MTMATTASEVKESDTHEGKNGGPVREKLAKGNEILRVRAGSVVYGTSTGASDADEMGVCIPPPEYVAGLRHFELYEHHTAWERPGGLRNRSVPGDLDLTIYSARKFLVLAMNGNPSIIEKLFTPHEHVITATTLGRELMELHPHVVSRLAGPRYLRCLHRQRLDLLSHEGKGRDVTRPELVEEFGYDVKFAAHMVRLGFMGRELLETGRLTLPMRGIELEVVRAIRKGEWSMRGCLTLAEDLEYQVGRLQATSQLPAQPDRDRVDAWLVEAHQRHWWLGNLI